jgi:3-phenylpropionate/trans-cinnamate dioxygenase ferredoxin subunit
MHGSLDESWHFAGVVDDFEDEDVEQVKVGPLAIALYRAKGEFYATQDLCTHERAYLSDGVVIDCVVECPFHQGRFDVRTGRALGAPVTVSLKTYPVKIVERQIYIRVDDAEAIADAKAQASLSAGSRI